MIKGYARVSTLPKKEEGSARLLSHIQNNRTQLQMLEKCGAVVIYTEHANGGNWKRPQLQKMLDELKVGDIILVYKLDRISRSLKDLIRILEIIEKKKAFFKCVTQQIDTTTPVGRLTFHILGAVAEFEKTLISERTKDGLQQAKREGRIGGRRYRLPEEDRKQILLMAESGCYHSTQIADRFGVCQSTINKFLRKHNIKIDGRMMNKGDMEGRFKPKKPKETQTDYEETQYDCKETSDGAL